jgi:hypothetical protein
VQGANSSVSNGTVIGCAYGIKGEANYVNFSNVQCLAQTEAGVAVRAGVGSYTNVQVRDSENDGFEVWSKTSGNTFVNCSVMNSANQNIQSTNEVLAVCATTANIVLSGEQTIDDVLTSADRVLVKDQTDATENGVYLSAAGAWARAADCTDYNDIHAYSVYITGGTVNAGKFFRLANNWDTIYVGSIGVEDLEWVESYTNQFFGGNIGPNINVTPSVLPERNDFHNIGGYVTFNAGTATLLAAEEFVTVTHGLTDSPTVVFISPLTLDWGLMTQFATNTFNDTSFRIASDVAPGSDVLFAWEARILPPV